MKNYISHVLVLIFVFICKVSPQVTFLDNFQPLLRYSWAKGQSLVQHRTFDHGVELNIKYKKTQPQFPSNFPFFCDTRFGRSFTVPTSVHKLRPGDIDIVGAIGDSLTTGASAFSLNPLQIVLDGKGVSWSIGGQYSWRQFLTLPNILKEFNPKVYGFSLTGQGNSFRNSSRFNVAEVLAKTSDTIFQAQNLVKRMRSDSQVNMKNHWKLVTLMIGAIDFCVEICIHNERELLDKAAKDLVLTLRILRENLPRTLVNIVLPPDASIVTRMTKKPADCQLLHYWMCPCFCTTEKKQRSQSYMITIKRWYMRMTEVVRLPEFHNKIDFEVNLFSMFIETDVPKDFNGVTEYKYLARDCFHLSQLGHARTANAYWNAMMTKESLRDRQWKKEFEEFKCPTTQNPFLVTTKNS